jgi:hypothetical protein
MIAIRANTRSSVYILVAMPISIVRYCSLEKDTMRIGPWRTVDEVEYATLERVSGISAAIQTLLH